MGSKQENSYGLIDKAKRGMRVFLVKARQGVDLTTVKIKRGYRWTVIKAKDGFGYTLVKVRLGKLPLSRLTAFLLKTNHEKIKNLKAKYGRTKEQRATSLNKTSKVSIDLSKFSSVNKGLRTLYHRLPFQLPGNFVGGRKIKAVAAGLLIFILAGVAVGANLKVDAYAVEADGQKIAITTEKAAAERILAELKTEKIRLWNRRVDVKQNLSFENIKAKRYQVDNLLELKNKLNKNITFVAVATGIKVNGQVAAVVKDHEMAGKVLDELKKEFTAEDLELDNVSFEEKVELADVPVSLKDIASEEDALRILKEGKQKKVTHVVAEGDSLWSIARSNDMHVADLLAANPSIKGEHLDLGQEINLVALEPVINVVVTGQRTVKETVPYRVVVQTDRSLWRGRQKVKSPGENGAREVTYKVVLKNGVVVDKNVLNEKVLKVAQDKIVVKGSRLVVASRGAGGKLGWPIGGRITSGYGSRWGSRHTGIDIDGQTGQPVGAAAAGVVVGAGWDGGYGKLVTIRHSNGLVTRYGHLSKIEVSVGQSVDRGDLIGLVGSTGRSTGSHLHFEVLSGGSFQSPLKFLR